MPFELFLIPGIICLIVGFLRGLSDYKRVVGPDGLLSVPKTEQHGK